MMKRILVASAAFVTVAAMTSTASAASPSVGSTFAINGSVAAVCSLGNLPGSQTVTLTNLTNADGTLNTAAFSGLSLNLGTVWCNGSHNSATVTAVPLVSDQTGTFDASQFANRIDLTLNATFGGSTFPVVDTAGGPTTGKSVNGTVGIVEGAAAGNVTPDALNSLKLVAGTYSGSVTISVTPGV